MLAGATLHCCWDPGVTHVLQEEGGAASSLLARALLTDIDIVSISW